jgi:Tfp pilus assembly protein PilF
MAYLQMGEIDKAKKSLTKSLSMSQNFDGASEAKKALADLGK